MRCRVGGFLLFLCGSVSVGDAYAAGLIDREAAVVRSVGVVRYFYPHESTELVQWPAVLQEGFELAATAADDETFAQELAALLSLLGDGIGLTGDRVAVEREACSSGRAPLRWIHHGVATAPAKVEGVNVGIYDSQRRQITDDRHDQPFEDAPRLWAETLPGGQVIGIPLVLCPEDAALTETKEAHLANRFSFRNELSDAQSARLDVATLWPVLEHFYPYWKVVDGDWDAALTESLARSQDVVNAEEHRRVLLRLLATLQDGHVNVLRGEVLDQGWLGFAVERFDGEVVVTESLVDQVRPADRVVVIDGLPAKTWWARELELYGGSPQFEELRVRRSLIFGTPGQRRTVRIEREESLHTVEIEYGRHSRAQRPEPIRLLQPGTWYVDLTTVEPQRLTENLNELASADAVVFDLRGYPTPPPAFLQNLLKSEDDWDDWMRVMLARAPAGDLVVAKETGWRLRPQSPHIGARVAFLTNEKAISYAESILGMVRKHKLGIIVGSATAGANGNVNFLSLPGGFEVHYTGLSVMGPNDEPIQARGILPDIEVRPSLAGIVAGRDEVLERALEALQPLPPRGSQ